MDDGKRLNMLEAQFFSLVETMDAGTRRGVRWKDDAKSIIWARDRIKELEARVAFLEAFADPPDMETGKTRRDELAAKVEELKAAMQEFEARLVQGEQEPEG